LLCVVDYSSAGANNQLTTTYSDDSLSLPDLGGKSDVDAVDMVAVQDRRLNTARTSVT